MQLELALARQERLSQVADRASGAALRVWQAGMTIADFDTAWAGITDRLTGITAAGQAAAAGGASAYVGRVAAADGLPGPAGGVVQPAAFTGVDGSGRTLEGLLYGAVTSAKTAVGAGAGVQSAFLIGATYLATMVHTAILDAGRSSDLTASTSRQYTHYVRVVSGGACSRCAMLAGISSGKEAFLRHPRCRCTAAPVTDVGTVKGRYSSPDAYFRSLTAAEQDRVFTRAGAEAIRAGADPVAVVSARRGARGIDYSRAVLSPRTLAGSGRRLERSIIGRRADGSPILGYTTGEGTTVRGQFARRQVVAGSGTHRVGAHRYSTARRIRLMPETIVGLTDDVALRTVLLRDAGYLDVPLTGSEMSAPLMGGYTARRNALIVADRAEADAFYRSIGVALGG